MSLSTALVAYTLFCLHKISFAFDQVVFLGGRLHIEYVSSLYDLFKKNNDTSCSKCLGGGTQNGKRYIGELCLHKIFQKLLS